jgi:hypothetical protein
VAFGRVALHVGAALVCASAALSSPAAAQQAWLADWASRQTDGARALAAEIDPQAEFLAPTPFDLRRRPARRATEAEQARNDRTVAFYEAAIGGNSLGSLLWSGLETANPLTRRETYRWNSLRDQGMFDPDRRAAAIEATQNLGLANLRIGLSNHEIDLDRPDSWAEHDALVADLAAAGFNLSLDLHHFGVEDRFRALREDGATDHDRSYYLHPDWPAYFARFSAEAFRRYGGSVKAVTLVNEPETTVGFNSEMWHGAFPGWGDPRHGRYYVERAFAIAAAAVQARIAIEAEMRRTGRRVFFMHTEAAVYKPGRPDFNRFTRFFPSDLILGADWLAAIDRERLRSAPLELLGREARLRNPARRGALEWLLETYVFAAHDLQEQAARRERLAGLLDGLLDLHGRLKAAYGVAMTDDTVFAVDYYAHNEAKGASGAWLSPEPQLYAPQAQVAERRGLYALIMDYHQRYGLPMMVGETGTPFYAYGARWHVQLLLECAAAMADGAPLLGYVMYPLIDTHGWETALSVPKDRTSVNTGGLLDLALRPRPYVRALLGMLNEQTAQAAREEPAVPR